VVGILSWFRVRNFGRHHVNESIKPRRTNEVGGCVVHPGECNGKVAGGIPIRLSPPVIIKYLVAKLWDSKLSTLEEIDHHITPVVMYCAFHAKSFGQA
jgi:hypothetical protein